MSEVTTTFYNRYNLDRFVHVLLSVFFICLRYSFFMTGYLPVGFEFAAEIT